MLLFVKYYISLNIFKVVATYFHNRLYQVIINIKEQLVNMYTIKLYVILADINHLLDDELRQ